MALALEADREAVARGHTEAEAAGKSKGVVHPWVGQNRLKRNVLKTKFES